MVHMPELKLKKKKDVCVCLGFPVIGYACQVQEVQPTEVKGYNVQLIGCENDTARVHSSTVIPWAINRILSNSVQETIHVLPTLMLIHVTSHMKLFCFFNLYDYDKQ